MASSAKSNRRIVREGRRYWSDRPTSGGKASGVGYGMRNGSFTRCVSRVQRFMGPRARGYCALRFKEATGAWPGSRANRGTKGRRR